MNSTLHPIAPEEIMAFLDGELSAERAQSLSTHIEQCAECQGIGTSFRNISAAISNWEVAPAPAQLEARVAAAVATNSAASETLRSAISPHIGRWTLRRPILGLVGVIAMALFVIVVSVPNLRFAGKAPIYSAEYGRQQAEGIAGHAYINRAPSASTHVAGDSNAFYAVDVGSLSDKSQAQMQAMVVTKSGKTPLEPMIARTVSLSVVVKEFDAARASLDAVLAHHNGYASSLNVSTPQSAARTLQASLRIPAHQVAAALNELKSLGRVEAETQNGEEVTQQHADLVARLKNSRETEQRLQDVLRTRTGKVKDVLEVEEEIARVRGEIEQMEAEQQTLEHRVDFATIDLKLAEEYKAQLSSPAPSVATQLRNASVNGFRSAFETLLALVLFFAESGPTLLLWLAILFFPAWLLWRRYRRNLALSSSLPT
jgi:anti-sigma factor RsiW/DNA-binding transcriptional regulator YhcF (GntR family)